MLVIRPKAMLSTFILCNPNATILSAKRKAKRLGIREYSLCELRFLEYVTERPRKRKKRKPKEVEG